MDDHDENAYQALAAAGEDAESRWAFGTGFDDPLAGIDTDVALPSGVDTADLAAYGLMLGDDALVASQRLGQWCSNAPELEEEVALANIGLDLLGQARLLYTRAAGLDPSVRPATAGGRAVGASVAEEDALAYFRDPGAFRHVTLVELENGDFACSIARLLVFATWRLAVMSRIADAATDPVLAAIAAKAVKELTYHRDYAANWLVRLGDGTEYSRSRVREGLATVLQRYPELFAAHPVERRLTELGAAVDPASVRDEVAGVLRTVLDAATLTGTDGVAPPADEPELSGRHGAHGPEFAELLTEMQSVAREHPEATW
jgi:ring-1,2-phenylacetyl-CoA epoxidase subunit PaaC